MIYENIDLYKSFIKYIDTVRGAHSHLNTLVAVVESKIIDSQSPVIELKMNNVKGNITLTSLLVDIEVNDDLYTLNLSPFAKVHSTVRDEFKYIDFGRLFDMWNRGKIGKQELAETIKANIVDDQPLMHTCYEISEKLFEDGVFEEIMATTSIFCQYLLNSDIDKVCVESKHCTGKKNGNA